MKAYLKLADHSELSSDKAIEVWYDGKLIACVYGGDGPVVRVVSRHFLEAHPVSSCKIASLNVIEVSI